MKVSELFEETERSVTSVMGEQPEHNTRDFLCDNNKLTSLEGLSFKNRKRFLL